MASPLAQSRQGGACQQDRRDKIDIDHGLQLGLGCVLEAPGFDATGVVHQDVEATERFDCLFQGGRTTIRRRHVGHDPADRGPACLEHLDGRLDCAGATAADGDLRSLGQKCLR